MRVRVRVRVRAPYLVAGVVYSTANGVIAIPLPRVKVGKGTRFS